MKRKLSVPRRKKNEIKNKHYKNANKIGNKKEKSVRNQ